MTTGMSAVCQSSLSTRAAMKPETRGIWTSSTTASGWWAKHLLHRADPVLGRDDLVALPGEHAT